MRFSTHDRLMAFGIGLVVFWPASLVGAALGGMPIDLIEVCKMGAVAALGAAVLAVLPYGANNDDNSD